MIAPCEEGHVVDDILVDTGVAIANNSQGAKIIRGLCEAIWECSEVNVDSVSCLGGAALIQRKVDGLLQ